MLTLGLGVKLLASFLLKLFATEWAHCVDVLLMIVSVLSLLGKRHNTLLVLLFVCSLGWWWIYVG